VYYFCGGTFTDWPVCIADVMTTPSNAENLFCDATLAFLQSTKPLQE